MKFVWIGLDNYYLLRLLNYCFRRDSKLSHKLYLKAFYRIAIHFAQSSKQKCVNPIFGAKAIDLYVTEIAYKVNKSKVYGFIRLFK
jgi:hypothetical protein